MAVPPSIPPQRGAPNIADLIAAKGSLRLAARRVRRAAATAAASAAPDVCARFLAAIAVPPGAVVAGYWPINDELDSRPLMRALAERGHPLALPIVESMRDRLAFRAYREGDPLRAASFGTSVPAADAAELCPHVFLVPLLAFDRQGHRLGYGKGYYDRTLAHARLADPACCAVGLAYAAQEIAAVPVSAHDTRLDWLVTEEGAVRFT